MSDGANLPPFSTFSLVESGVKFGAHIIGSPEEMREAAGKSVKPWVEERFHEPAKRNSCRYRGIQSSLPL